MINKKDIKPKETDKIITITNLIDEEERYILNPPYQRGNVWEEQWKIDLIESIFKKIPLNNITLVEKVEDAVEGDDNEIKYIVLDGKQRISTIFDFIEGKFKYPFILPDSSIRKASYQEMKEAAKDSKDKNHKFFSNLYSNFKGFNLRSVVYPDIDWRDQINLFDKINHSKELSKHEKFTAKYIFVKDFVKFLNKNHNTKLSSFISEQKKTSKEGKDWTFKFRILGCLMGFKIDQPKIDHNSFASDTFFNKKDFTKFMSDLNQKLEDYMVSEDDQYLFDSKDRVLNMIKTFKWNNLLENSKKLDQITSFLISINNNYTYNVLYFSIFILEKMQSDIITNNMFEKYKKDIENIYINYCKWAAEKGSKDRVSRAGSFAGRDLHFNYIEKLFKESSISLEKKYLTISKTARDLALVRANNQCEFPGCANTDELQIDHVSPASLNGETVIGVLCSMHNRQKADNTTETMRNFIAYIESKNNISME